jgi:hypothetical protein
LIEIFPDTPFDLRDLFIILFGVDEGRDQYVLDTISEYLHDDAYIKEIGTDQYFDPSPDLENCRIIIMDSQVFKIEFECGISDSSGGFDVGAADILIRNGKVDRFTFEEL